MIMSFVNNIIFCTKRFIFSIMIIYGYNVIVFPTIAPIPMNIFTIGLIMLLGFPVAIGISLFSLFFF